mgnify:CR=1 FL=1
MKNHLCDYIIDRACHNNDDVVTSILSHRAAQRPRFGDRRNRCDGETGHRRIAKARLIHRDAGVAFLVHERSSAWLFSLSLSLSLYESRQRAKPGAVRLVESVVVKSRFTIDRFFLSFFFFPLSRYTTGRE